MSDFLSAMAPLCWVGLACIIVAIIGGGLEILGVKVPVISSRPRQALLAALGIVLILICVLGGRGTCARIAGNWQVRTIDGKDQKDANGNWSGTVFTFSQDEGKCDGVGTPYGFSFHLSGNVFSGSGSGTWGTCDSDVSWTGRVDDDQKTMRIKTHFKKSCFPDQDLVLVRQ